MKKVLLSFAVLLSLAVQAQEASEIKPAAKGVIYGETPAEKGDAVTTVVLIQKATAAPFEGRITGKVTEVCKAMGCWIRLDKGDGTTLMVKTKDHAFFLPENLVGKTVLIEGTASVKEVSEDKRKHFAEDAGKSKEEIKKIKGSAKEVQFIASGIRVVD